MKISIKYWRIILITFLFYSCSGWSKKDKEIYLSECKRAKLDTTFCDCSLNKIINKYLSEINCDILLTHPMFGPDSAKSSGLANSWNNKNFVYWKERTNNSELLDKFLSFNSLSKYFSIP